MEDHIDKLTEEKKSQAQYCILYISRVVYPFWNATILSGDMTKELLITVYEKLTELFSLVDFLKV